MWIAARLSSRNGCSVRGSPWTPTTSVSLNRIGVGLGVRVGAGVGVGGAGVTDATTTNGPGLPHAAARSARNAHATAIRRWQDEGGIEWLSRMVGRGAIVAQVRESAICRPRLRGGRALAEWGGLRKSSGATPPAGLACPADALACRV